MILESLDQNMDTAKPSFSRIVVEISAVLFLTLTALAVVAFWIRAGLLFFTYIRLWDFSYFALPITLSAMWSLLAWIVVKLAK